MNKKKKNSSDKFIVILILLLIAAAAAGILLAVNWQHINKILNPVSSSSDQTEGAQAGVADANGMIDDKWEEGEISYNGKKYKYNNNQNIYLFMGIDTDNKVQEAEDSNSGGQSDALFLLVQNQKDSTMKVVSIHRNTMTRIFTCDKDGNSTGYTEAQICVQHGFGDGEQLSCSRTVDAVSNLFYGLPINGYISLNVGGIPSVNDAIGGVSLSVLQTIQNSEISLTEGQEKTLSGKEAYYYVRYRDTNVYDSASARLERQKQYINKYLEKLKTKLNDGSVSASDIYDGVKDYVVTDLTVPDILSAMADFKYDDSNMYSVPGEVTQGEQFEEFHVDEDSFYEMILELFYVEADE